MKFSLITPEHDPNNKKYLLELFDCILEQTHKDWEWILYLNGNCSISDIDQKIANHPKVKLYREETKLSNIGHIKNNAFNLGTGDILVELDHDDLITSDCLEKLDVAFQDDEIGFVYSDNAILHMENQFVPFDSSFGWSYRTFNWKGEDLYAMRSFPPTSHSLCYIWYAPDHVRAWRSSTYKELGGHNKDLYICDDHELCIRTYLHTKMKHIPEVLYIYRITGINTWLQRNQEIQTKTVELCNKYAYSLAERDAEFKNLLKIDLGGGLNPFKDYKTVDSRESADYVCDLNEGIPLPDNSVAVINASHVIEHLKDPIKTMSEIHRVLCHGGWAFIEVPSTDGRGAFQDPTHVSYWNENSFMYYTDKELAKYINNTNIRFQQYRKQTHFPNDWLKSINVCVTTAWLIAIKEETPRYPSELKI